MRETSVLDFSILCPMSWTSAGRGALTSSCRAFRFRLTFHSKCLNHSRGHHDGQSDYLFSSHMPVLCSGTANGVESKYDRNRPHHGAAVNAVCNLRAPPRNVGRQRNRTSSDPRIRGDFAYSGEQAIGLVSYLSCQMTAASNSAIARPILKWEKAYVWMGDS
jgi:hypothetical protein